MNDDKGITPPTLEGKKPIDSTPLYNIYEPTWFHCGESQFRYVCKAHEEAMGCYYCEFDYSQPCDHAGELPSSEMDALRAILQANIMKSKGRK